MEVEKKPTHTPLAGALLGTGGLFWVLRNLKKMKKVCILGHFFELFHLHSQLLVVLHVNVHTSVQTHTEQVALSTKSLWSPAHPTVPAEPVPSGPSQCTARASQTPLLHFHFGIMFTLFLLSLSFSLSLFLLFIQFISGLSHCSVYSVVLFSITYVNKRKDSIKIYFGAPSCFSIYVITLSHISATMWPQ